jgi:hypothetical protein
MVSRTSGERLLKVLVSALRPGDYVIAAHATVLAVEFLAYHGLVRLAGRSALTAMPREAMVSIYRSN